MPQAGQLDTGFISNENGANPFGKLVQQLATRLNKSDGEKNLNPRFVHTSFISTTTLGII